MPQEILAIAIYEPLPDLDADALKTIREIMAALAAKGYSRDLLYKDSASQYVLLRYWTSEQARKDAQEDPQIQRFWARLGNEIRIVKVLEQLVGVPVEEAK